jgi:uncharacterized protein
MPEGALSNDQLEELDALLDELRTRGDEIPQWEFCDGFLTALVCTRRPIAAAEYMPMLLGDGEALQVAEGQPLPKLEVFKDEAQQARFMELFELRLAEVREQLDADIKSLADDAAFQPEALDTRGAIAILPEAEQAELAGEEVPRSRKCGRWASCSWWRTGPTNGPRHATRKQPSCWTRPWSSSST